MRQYYMTFGIFLIFSIIDFALAAPVLVREKRQTSADVVHIPKDSITVLWERGENEELVEWFLNGIKVLDGQNDFESSVAQASSSAGPPGTGHGSTNVLQWPTPNPASSTAKYYPPSTSTAAKPPIILEWSWTRPWKAPKRPRPKVSKPSPILKPPRPARRPKVSKPYPILDSSKSWIYPTLESSKPSTYPNWKLPMPPNPASSTANPNPILESSRPSGPVQGDGPPLERPALSKEPEQAHQHQMGQVQQVVGPGPFADPDSDRIYWANVLKEALRPAPPKRSNPGPSNPSLPTEPPSTAESTVVMGNLA